MNRPLIALTVWLIVLIGLLLPVESALGQSVWSRSGALSWQPDFCPICPSLSHPNEECPWAILGHHGPLEAAAVTRVETGRMGGVDSSAFVGMSYSHKKEYVDWIESAKRPETPVSGPRAGISSASSESG